MSADREFTFEDMLRGVAMAAAEESLRELDAAEHGAAPACTAGTACTAQPAAPPTAGTSAPASTLPAPPPAAPAAQPTAGNTILAKPVGRRGALGMMLGALAAGTQAASSCSPLANASDAEREARLLEWQEFIKGNYRLMTDAEQAATIDRLERLSKLRRGADVRISGTPAIEGVVFGYAFNISKCKGFRNCIEACIAENNLDRRAATHYIRIFELEQGEIDLDHADATYQHEVPAAGHFYLGAQCYQCANPPCVRVCPVSATWQEPDGITVVDYDWCIGCRYCMAACPYWARRFNWSEPVVPAEELNPNQHYLGNRVRKKGAVEKCTYCIQRSREGRLVACAEACPTGARVFGNLLDPDSEIRWILANKRVFRLKEDLKTEPRFWYFSD